MKNILAFFGVLFLIYFGIVVISYNEGGRYVISRNRKSVV